jgi:competence protein ComEA
MPSALQHARFGIDGRAVVGLLLVVVLAIGFGAIYLFKAKPVAEAAPRFPITATPDPGLPAADAVSGPPVSAASSGNVTASSQPAADLLVHVTGLVGRPGVVSLPRGARVVDALQAVGGALPGVDTSGLNLARALTDGEQVAVGVPGAGPPLATDSNASGAGAGTTDGGGSAPAGGVVDINRASAADLEELPGVGPVLAARIIDHRDRIGGFRSIDELQDVSGIGDRTFEDLRDKVTV